MIVSSLFRASRQSTAISTFARYNHEQKNPMIKTWNIMTKSNTRFSYPENTDIVIIGGGIIGAATAYWLKRRAGDGLSVVVIEKDFSYKQAQRHLQHGTLSQHFTLPENLFLSQFSAFFLRNIREHLDEDINVEYCPTGSLVLASNDYAQKLEETSSLLKEHGSPNELLSPKEINKKFPWINTADIKLGCMGVESEGTFNGWELHKGFVKKSKELGALYINAEVVGFDLEQQRDVLMEGVTPGAFERIMRVRYMTEDNEEYGIKFAGCILTAGSDSSEIAKFAKVGTGDGMLMVPLPVEKRKHEVYSLEGNNTEIGLNTPMIMDTTGLWLQRKGLGKDFLGGYLPSLDQNDNLVDTEQYLKTTFLSSLMHRIPSCNNAQVQSHSSLYYDCTTYDNSGILGPHPYHNNLYIAAGFGQLGCQHAPGLGRALTELIIDSQFNTIDLTRLGFDRLLTDQPMMECNAY